MTFTNVLVALNILVYLAELATGGPAQGRVVTWGVLDGPDVVGRHEWYRIVTAAFLHGGIAHISLNMIALAQVGTLVERFMGRARLFLIYAAAILGSSWAVLTFNFDQATLGASGAIFGLFGALVAVGLSLPPRGMSIVTQTLPVIGLNLAFGFAVPGISNAAHIGGLLSGFAVGFLLYLIPSQRREAADRILNGPAVLAGSHDDVARDEAIETIEQPPEAGPHEEDGAPPLELRDPADR